MIASKIEEGWFKSDQLKVFLVEKKVQLTCFIFAPPIFLILMISMTCDMT